MSCADQGTLTNCDDDEVAYIEQMRSQMQYATNNYLSFQKSSGIWEVACINHGYCIFSRCNSNNYEVPENSGYTVVESIDEWYVGQ